MRRLEDLIPVTLESSLGYKGRADWIFWSYEEAAASFEIGDAKSLYKGNVAAWEIFCEQWDNLADPGSINPTVTVDQGDRKHSEAPPMENALAVWEPQITLNGAYLLNRLSRRLYKADRDLIYRCIHDNALLQALAALQEPIGQGETTALDRIPNQRKPGILELPVTQTAIVLVFVVACCFGFGNPFNATSSKTRPTGINNPVPKTKLDWHTP